MKFTTIAIPIFRNTRMIRSLQFTLFLFITCILLSCTTSKNKKWLTNYKGFDDAIHHYKNKNGTSYERVNRKDFKAISNNLLLYQKINGGWVENQDPLRILSEKEKEEFKSQKNSEKVSFDNRNLFSQVEYLYGAYRITNNNIYKDAALNGLDLILKLQNKNCGGWPHTVPSTQSYHSHITFADEVTSGVLTLLYRIENKMHPFQDIHENYRRRAVLARQKGDECILRLQVRQGENLSIWAGQYDSASLKPADARSFELASLAAWESVAVVRYLMLQKPTPEIRTSVESAIQWFKDHEIRGYEIVDVPLTEEQKFDFHKATFDRKLIPDPKAKSLWGRFYDLDSNTVILANRDGKRVKAYEEIHIERRTGYQWYGNWPKELLEVDYPKWKAQLNK